MVLVLQATAMLLYPKLGFKAIKRVVSPTRPDPLPALPPRMVNAARCVARCSRARAHVCALAGALHAVTHASCCLPPRRPSQAAGSPSSPSRTLPATCDPRSYMYPPSAPGDWVRHSVVGCNGLLADRTGRRRACAVL